MIQPTQQRETNTMVQKRRVKEVQPLEMIKPMFTYKTPMGKIPDKKMDNPDSGKKFYSHIIFLYI